MPNPLTVYPVQAPVQENRFNLIDTLIDSIKLAETPLKDGDILAISSKYCAIAQGRVVIMEDVVVSDDAAKIAEHYVMNPQLTQLVLQEADHVFGGITHDFKGVKVGFLLTAKDGIIAPNAGLDRSNIPNGKVVLLPANPYETAAEIRRTLIEKLGANIGVILTDSWLMPGRIGTSGVAVGTAGFSPIQDERGKIDLFGNPMQVTQRGIADSICVCAQMVMGETAEATPVAIVRNTGVVLHDKPVTVDDVAVPWEWCIYIGALSQGRLEHVIDLERARQQVHEQFPRSTYTAAVGSD